MSLLRSVPRSGLSAVDVRDVPTLALPYGDVPVVHASAGMKRVISLAYLLTWAWDEHKRACLLRREKPVKHMLLLFDEMESHLHPRWQRDAVAFIAQGRRSSGSRGGTANPGDDPRPAGPRIS